MKGRSLRLDPTPGALVARSALTSLVLLCVLAPLSACGGDDDRTAAAAGLAMASATSAVDDDPMLVVPTTTAPATTAVAETAPASTVAPTVVETLPLPVPDPAPAPRAKEPYVELGRIQIPKIGIDTTLLQGITLNTLDLGPGHWPGTAMPGHIGNAVIAGHRTSHDKVFRNVDQLAPGDEVIFTTAEGDFVYAVSETTIVTPDAMYIIEQTYDATATLFACHPPGSTRERIVVHLDLTSSPAPVDSDATATTVAPSL